jgi:uncharacterized protein YqeY
MPDAPHSSEPETDEAEDAKERSVLGGFVKRALNSGLEAASRSKEDLVRVATNEMRVWLDRMDVQSEIAKALTKLVVEVKAEIRFRPKEGGGLEPEITSDIKTQAPKK